MLSTFSADMGGIEGLLPWCQCCEGAFGGNWCLAAKLQKILAILLKYSVAYSTSRCLLCVMAGDAFFIPS